MHSPMVLTQLRVWMQSAEVQKYKHPMCFSLTIHLMMICGGLLSTGIMLPKNDTIEIVASCEIIPEKEKEQAKTTQEMTAKVRNTVGGGKKKPIDNIMDSGQGDKFDKSAAWINKQDVDKPSAEKFERVLQKIREGKKTLESATVHRRSRKKIFSLGKNTDAKNPKSSMLATMIFEQVYKHWIVPASVRNIEKYVVVLAFELYTDGTISEIRVMNDKGNDPVFVVVADSARRAVKSAVPFKLPVGFKKNQITLQFNCAEAISGGIE